MVILQEVLFILLFWAIRQIYFQIYIHQMTKKSVQTYAFLEKSWNLLTHTTKLWKKKDSFRDNDLGMKSHGDAGLSSFPISASLCGQLWASLYRGE